MSTEAQRAANLANAQKSTGPVTPEGLQRSSQNASKHGFTGLKIKITEDEREAYDAHVAANHSFWESSYSHDRRDLVQRLADAKWSVHQLFVQQTNVGAMMNDFIDTADSSDPKGNAATIASYTQSLNRLVRYEKEKYKLIEQIQGTLTELVRIEKRQQEQARNETLHQAEAMHQAEALHQAEAVNAAKESSNSNQTQEKPEIGFVSEEPGYAHLSPEDCLYQLAMNGPNLSREQREALKARLSLMEEL